MTQRGYGLLKGQVLGSFAEREGDTPHFEIHVRGGDTEFRVAVNVLSKEAPANLLYVADENFQHPVLQALDGVVDGFATVPSQPGGVALDYIRGNLFDPQTMVTLPPNVTGPDNDLEDKLDHYVGRAITDPSARLFAFGQAWGPDPGKDTTFGFSPLNGVHEIHMNQGNDAAFEGEDGVWHDGGLFLNFPGESQWVAIFLAFQSQAWHTDDTTGHASIRTTERSTAPFASWPHSSILPTQSRLPSRRR